MRLLFIRHTSVNVPSGTCYGQSDVPVNDTFCEEARSVRERLSRYSVDKAYTSPLSRCTKLAEACGFNDAIRDTRLMEMDFGDWEMQRYDEISDPQLQRWFDDFINERASGGESFMDQRDRLQKFIARLSDESYNTVAIFTHAGILLHIMILYLGYTTEEAFKYQPAYGDIIEVKLS